MKPTLTDHVVYAAVRVGVCVLQALPVETARYLGGRIGYLLYRLDARHRRIARENLQAAYAGQLTDRQIDRVTRKVFQHFCTMAMELVHLPRVYRLRHWRRYVRLVGHEPVVRLLLEGRGALLVTGHFGNWEMVGHALGAYGFPVHAIARPLDNPLLEEYVARFRRQTGQTLIAKKGGFGAMAEALDARESLGILADQNAGSRGMFVEFFGRPASTHKAIALMALEYGAPLVVGCARRVEDRFFYEIVIEEIIDPTECAHEADPVRALTQRFTSAIERFVRRNPDQYLWLHRRWRSQPGDLQRKRKRMAEERARTREADGLPADSTPDT